MCGCNLVTPRLIGGGPRSSSGSLAMFAAIRVAAVLGQPLVGQPLETARLDRQPF
jgi:hypothetical protein